MNNIDYIHLPEVYQVYHHIFWISNNMSPFFSGWVLLRSTWNLWEGVLSPGSVEAVSFNNETEPHTCIYIYTQYRYSITIYILCINLYIYI